MENVIIFFGAILAAIGIGLYFKINLGVVGIALSFLLGRLYLGMGVSDIIAQFPMPLFFVLFLTTLFYGYAGENGALEGISLRVINRFSALKRLIPGVVLLSAIVVSALGAGAMATPVMLSPIAFSMAKRYRFHPLLASTAVWCGAMIGDSMPWGSTFQSNVARYSVFFDTEIAQHTQMLKVWWGLLLYSFLFCVLWILLGRKTKESAIPAAEIDTSAPFSRSQRITLRVIGGVIFLTIVPSVVELICPNPVTAWVKENLSIQLLVAIGTVFMGIFKVADGGKVLRNRVPWDMIMTISGLTMLMSFSGQMGVLETVAQCMQRGLPAWSILPVLIALVGTMTYFLDGRAIAALMIPLLPALTQVAGCSAEEMILAYMFAGAAPSISPFSTGGAMALSGCDDDAVREQCVRMQMWIPWPILTALITLGGLGLFGLFV